MRYELYTRERSRSGDEEMKPLAVIQAKSHNEPTPRTGEFITYGGRTFRVIQVSYEVEPDFMPDEHTFVKVCLWLEEIDT